MTSTFQLDNEEREIIKNALKTNFLQIMKAYADQANLNDGAMRRVKLSLVAIDDLYQRFLDEETH